MFIFCNSRLIPQPPGDLDHYRALRMIYKDETSSFKELLRKDSSITIHHRNLQQLVIEMFKVFKGMAPAFMKDVLTKNENIEAENVSSNTRSQVTFYNAHNPKTVNYGLETLRTLGPKLWEMLPTHFKEIQSLPIFKQKIKQWIPNKCPCRLCKSYLPQVGYIS